MPITKTGKFLFSLLMGGLFFALASPETYKMTDSFFGNVIGKGKFYKDFNACPTALGHLSHALIFFMLIYVVMLVLNMFYKTSDKKSKTLLFKYAFYSALLFHTISSTELYTLVAIKFGNGFATSEGCAKDKGVLLHAVLFFLVKYSLMSFKKD